MATLKLPGKETPAEVVPEQNNDRQMLAATPELNPRTQILREIAERSNLQADADASETIPGTDEDGNPTEPASLPDTSTTPADDAETGGEAAPIDEPAPPGFDPDLEYELTINGQPVKVKGSQIIETGKASLQKEIAADYKLELAANLLKEAQAQRQTAPVKQEEKAPELTAEQLAEIIQFGDKDQAAAAIRHIMGNQNSGKQDLDGLVQAMPKMVSDQLAFQEAASFVQSEYKDLLDDPYLKPLFLMKENQLRETGDKRSYKELYKSIGDELRVHFNRPAPSANKTMEEKREAKAAAPAAPRLASARMETQAEQKPPTREEIFYKMQVARGQRPATTIN